MNKHFKRLAGAMMAATIVGSAAVLSQDIMPINIMSVSAASETNIVIDGVHYDFYTDALTATIVGIDDSITSFTTPETVTYNGITYKVNSIGNYSCTRKTNLQTLTISENIEYIGDMAFGNCYSLESATINGTPEIKRLTFDGCNHLKEVNLDDNITVLSDNMFSGCEALETIELPSHLETIGNNAFSNCRSLTSISIPDSVHTISNSAFSECISLTSIELSSNLETIGKSAFSNCYSLTSILIPDSIQTISESAFEDCIALTSISIPDSIQTISKSTFEGCSSITYVKLPNNLTKIESGAFRDCTLLEMPIFPTTLSSIGDQAFSDTPSMTGTLILPETITNIGRCCFSSSGISEVYSKCSAAIDNYAFSYTPNLEKVTLSGNEVMECAFYSCENLSNLVVPLSAKNNWNGSAFEDCKNLKYINDEKVRYSYDDVIKDAVFTNSEDMDKFIRTHFNASTGVGFIESYVDYYCDEVIKRYITPDMTDTQKAKALHDWIIKKVNYDHDDMYAEKNHCECSVFINDTTVCEGYARGYAKIMNRAGIETEYFANFDHAWNKCKFGDIYLNVDTCWDDCGDEAYYKWFLISDREVLERNTSSHYDVDVIEPHAEYPMGDLNMDKVVDVADYRILQKNLSKNELDKNQLILADINFDGKLDNMDLRGIKEKCMSRYDLNGDRKLNNSDHALLQFAIVKQLELSSSEYYKFDINNDGVLDWKDAKDMRDFLEKYCNQDKNAYYRMGDLNLDGTVDREDYNALQDYIKNKTKFKADYYLADIANDHLFIDIFDLGILDELTKYEIGDVNFDNHIDVNDKNLIMEHIAGNTELPDAALWYADINGDGAIDNKDVTELVRILG